MSDRISWGRILLRDWPSASWLIFSGLCLTLLTGVAVYSWLRSDAESLRFAAYFMAAAFTPTCLIWGSIVAWRVQLIARLLAEGPRVVGRIHSLGENSEDITHAVVVYNYEGQTYRSIVTTQSLFVGFSPQPGDEVELLVDPHGPKRVFFVKMFAAGRQMAN